MRFFLVIVYVVFVSANVFSQSVADLRQKKQAAEKEIELTTQLLNEVQKNERTSLNRLRLINNRIDQRNNLISTITEEIKVYQECVENNIMVIEMLNSDMEQIKKEYAEMIRTAYRNSNSYNLLLFLLSADDFNQAYRRYLYTKRYTVYRKNQATLINAVQAELNDKIIRLERQNEQKKQLIEDTNRETQKLTEEKTQQNAELQKLRSQGRTLRQKLNDQQKIEQQLEKEIQRIIDEEARKNKAEGGSGFVLTPEQKLVGDNFAQNKSRLPWPVERGVITEYFGMHQHPVLTNVKINNNGINIATETGAKVRAIFNGEVSRVFGITGGNTAVIIRHGTYLTVYSNLSEVVVKKGDKVETKQVIGTVFADPEDNNKSILKFQIWQENQKLNPEEWIGH